MSENQSKYLKKVQQTEDIPNQSADVSSTANDSENYLSLDENNFQPKPSTSIGPQRPKAKRKRNKKITIKAQKVEDIELDTTDDEKYESGPVNYGNDIAYETADNVNQGTPYL